MNFSEYLTVYVLTCTWLTIAALLIGLFKSIAASDLSAKEKEQAKANFSLVLIAWFGLALFLALLGVYKTGRSDVPVIPIAIILPIMLGTAAVLRWSKFVDAIPQTWLIGIQFYRIIGGVFLFLHAINKMPGLFAWPAGIGDLMVGIAAPFVAAKYQNNPDANINLVRIWNWVGILDLVIAVGTGMTTAPSIFQRFALDLPNVLVGIFPLVMIPTYLVPIAIILHVASLTKLSRNHQKSGLQQAC